MTCIEKDACVLVEQDLNSDGQAERILFALMMTESLSMALTQTERMGRA